jgi:hypothetical protein
MGTQEKCPFPATVLSLRHKARTKAKVGGLGTNRALYLNEQMKILLQKKKKKKLFTTWHTSRFPNSFIFPTLPVFQVAKCFFPPFGIFERPF